MRGSVLSRKLRVLRAEQGLTIGEASKEAGVSADTLGLIERGKRAPQVSTLRKLGDLYGVSLDELLQAADEREPALPLADAPQKTVSPSLEDLHEEAGCATNWLTMPEAEWRASWPLSLTPRDAMQIVQEMAEEFSALKPLIAAHEVGLPIYKSAISGRYKQAWLRFLEGMRVAHKCGVANGLITQEQTLNELEEKLELGETPGVRYEGMMYAS